MQQNRRQNTTQKTTPNMTGLAKGMGTAQTEGRV